ncbi:MAG: hypothetical protein FJ399_07525 [Verrucomicrobia bacterium]|nr:hypothetical protein [Verrucomicrobiota bacterium]
MKTTSIILSASVLVSSSLSGGEIKRPLPIKDETWSKLRELSAQQPNLRAAMLPEDPKGTRIDILAVPATAREHAVRWIRKTISPDWLPEDLERRLGALKDTRIFEYHGKHGTTEVVADFITLDYEIDGFGFHLHEKGDGLIVRINFPTRADLEAASKLRFRELMLKFFLIPKDELSPEGLKVVHLGPVQELSSLKPLLWKVDATANRILAANWWEPLRAYSDGEVLIVMLREVEPGGRAEMSRPGPPDRF